MTSIGRRKKQPTAQPHRSRAGSSHRVIGVVSWAVLIGGLFANQVAEQASYQTGQAILLATLAAFFPLLVIRLVVAARYYPNRRAPLLLLAVSIAVWALGSFSVNAASLEEQQHFPSPGEWLFVLSYLGLAGHLITDAGWKRRGHSRDWLDVAVVCGATTCLASLLLVTPIRIASGEGGLPLLLGVMYPLADLLLALFVLGQTVMRSRTDHRKTIMIGAGFLMIGIADSGFAVQVSAPTYDFGNTSNAFWGCGFALLVAAACRPPQPPRPSSASRVVGTPLLVGASVIALTELSIRPDETLAFYTVPPAVLTMTAVGARMVLALRDANKAAEAVALSRTDDLTTLPNRRALRARMTEALDENKPLALMLLDLDGFKEINDSLGHHAGDIVLTFVAAQMQDALGNDVMVARLGGDEFAILLESVDELALVETAHRVLDAIERPVVVDDIELSPSGSIGITVVKPTDTLIDGGEVLRRADVAMYQAKSSRSRAALYDAHLDEFSRTRLEMAEDLRKGLTNKQIEVWYQPQIDATTMEVYAVEALVRWRHPTQGLLSPVAFLPTARRVGLMGPLSDRIAWQAVRDLRHLADRGFDLQLALNCAPPELLSAGFLPRLYSTLSEWKIAPDRLTLEVTEDSFLTEPQRARDILLEVRARGIQVSIDDYGTGFSSLTYLRNLPIQELKIDRSLIRDISTDERSKMIVASTIQLAHALNMRTVAEGVEDAIHMDHLVELGIDSLQGYHLAKPMPASELEGWLREWNHHARERSVAQTHGAHLKEPS